MEISTPIKWVKPGNWHLTLKFIGEVTPEKCQQIIQLVRNIRFAEDPFELSLSGFGKFGRRGNLNIFWAGILPSKPLNDIHERIENALAELGIKKENRFFSPHLTLGRNRKSFHSTPFFSLIEKHRSLPICHFQVAGFSINESVLTPEGPIYTTLQEIHLGPS